jgi:hypothetical protein
MKTFVRLLVACCVLVLLIFLFNGCSKEGQIRGLGHIYDNANIIDESDEYSLEDLLSRLDSKWQEELVIVTLSDSKGLKQLPPLYTDNGRMFIFINEGEKITFINEAFGGKTTNKSLNNTKEVSTIVREEVVERDTRNFLSTLIAITAFTIFLFVMLVLKTKKK